MSIKWPKVGAQDLLVSLQKKLWGFRNPVGFLEEVWPGKDGLDSETILSSKPLKLPSLCFWSGCRAPCKKRENSAHSIITMYSLSSPGNWLGRRHLWFSCWCKCSVLGTHQDAWLVCFAEQPHKEATVPFSRSYKLFSIWVDREIFIQGAKILQEGITWKKNRKKKRKFLPVLEK